MTSSKSVQDRCRRVAVLAIYLIDLTDQGITQAEAHFPVVGNRGTRSIPAVSAAKIDEAGSTLNLPNTRACRFSER